MLASHTHEGQIWPFGYLVRVNHPFLSGRYEVNGMTVIVCRGTGTWGPRMRLWHRGEIVRITLRHGRIGGRQLFSVQRKAKPSGPHSSWKLGFADGAIADEVAHHTRRPDCDCHRDPNWRNHSLVHRAVTWQNRR